MSYHPSEKARGGVWSPITPIFETTVKLESQPDSNATQIITQVVEAVSRSTGSVRVGDPVS